MVRDFDALDLLVLWHRWEASHDLDGLGYPRECPSTAGYRASRQWDDANGAMECDERGQLARRIGYVVQSIPDPYRTALHLLARNRACGVNVWSSPRLPADKEQRAEVVSEALARFESLM